MEDKDIVLDEKTRKMIMSIFSNIKILQDKADAILQVVVNTKFPNSDDLYELSEDMSKLVFINKKEST